MCLLLASLNWIFNLNYKFTNQDLKFSWIFEFNGNLWKLGKWNRKGKKMRKLALGINLVAWPICSLAPRVPSAQFGADMVGPQASYTTCTRTATVVLRRRAGPIGSGTEPACAVVSLPCGPSVSPSTSPPNRDGSAASTNGFRWFFWR
jgi:hypothetical protein